jgi:sodium/potassium-transporting ATPase subunit beta
MLGVTAVKPKERHGMEAIQYFFFDKDTGAVMGRTPKSWALITLFYVVYYALLAGFWTGCMCVFLYTIDEKVPRWTEDGSLIGRSQSLGVRPNQSDEFIDSGLIIFNTAVKESTDGQHVAGWGEWSARVDSFLSSYRKSKGVDCAGGAKTPPEGKFCKFPLELLGPCGTGDFGYDVGKPCIILKLNKIYGLVPEYYNDPANVPDNFPPRLTKLMSSLVPADRDQVRAIKREERGTER